MEKIIVNNQLELDSIDLNFVGTIIVVGGDDNYPINIKKNFEKSKLILSGYAVVGMWENSQVREMRGNSQVKYMYGNSQVNYMYDNSQVNYMFDNSQVNYMYGNSQVIYMYGNSQVRDMWEYSQVNYMYGNSKVREMWENSQVRDMWEYSQVNYMYDNSQVREMWGNSQVNYMKDSSQVNYMKDNSKVREMWEYSQVRDMLDDSQVNHMYDNSQVREMWGNSQVREMWGNSQVKIYSEMNKIYCYGYNYIFISNEIINLNNILLNNTSQILRFNTFKSKPDIEFYLQYNKINRIGDSLILYKAVHKSLDGEYYSDFDNDFIYRIGETIINKCSDNINNSCDYGLHISNINFAIKYGKNWSNFAILEVLVPKDKIIVTKDCDGNVRTSELTVIREINLNEIENL